MAKRLLLNVLVNALGDYIEGLTEENLKLGVWSGQIELNNLVLNRKSLHKLNLPLTVVYGSVSKLKVYIPWTSLDSSPVKITVDGVTLLVSPIDFNGLNKEDLKQQELVSKQQKLIAAEKAVELSVKLSSTENSQSTMNASYIQRLTTKILDNLEIKIQNIHVSNAGYL